MRRMLIDLHRFPYTASVPWPYLTDAQYDWEYSISEIEKWLLSCVGERFAHWAWNDSGHTYQLGVGFQLEKHRSLFVLRWASDQKNQP